MTRKLYLDDSYRGEFQAAILDSRKTGAGWEVLLEETCFYPESGGQPADQGSIGGVPVIDVQLRGEQVVHVLSAEPPRSPVTAKIDWPRRYDHMQQHTGQHLLTAALIKLFDADTVGFHLGEQVCTIDVTLAGLNAERRHKAEELCLEWIAAALPVRVEYIDEAEFERISLRKKALSEEVSGPVRLLRIGDVDVAHCGGTHLRSTAEIHLIKIVGSEKVRDTIRISFLAGRRVLADYAAKHDMLAQIATDLTCGVEILPATIARLKEQARESHKQLKKLRAEMISGMAEREAAAAESAGKIRILARRYDGWDADELKTLAGKVTEIDPAIVVCAAGGDESKGALVLAAGSAFDGDLGETIKHLLPLFDARGGGRGRFAQAAGDFSKLDVVIATARKLLTKD
jgi:alanyl-tRNA synthetase